MNTLHNANGQRMIEITVKELEQLWTGSEDLDGTFQNSTREEWGFSLGYESPENGGDDDVVIRFVEEQPGEFFPQTFDEEEGWLNGGAGVFTENLSPIW